ncbi:uncharacterized protein LOC134837253 [Culicoides brevitarsis]|uniref:uncharacterized protein LOC134837253 n=1 Tax=Culicoides brevitarsis TaxID=469753 RepID=UPI00307C4354
MKFLAIIGAIALCSGVFAGPLEKPESRVMLYTDPGYVNYTNTVASFATIQTTSWSFMYTNAVVAVFPFEVLILPPTFTYYSTVSTNIVAQCNIITTGLHLAPSKDGITMIDQAMTSIVNIVMQGQLHVAMTNPEAAKAMEEQITAMQKLQVEIIKELTACSAGSIFAIIASPCTHTVMYKISAFLMMSQTVTNYSYTTWSHDVIYGPPAPANSTTTTTTTTPSTTLINNFFNFDHVINNFQLYIDYINYDTYYDNNFFDYIDNYSYNDYNFFNYIDNYSYNYYNNNYSNHDHDFFYYFYNYDNPDNLIFSAIALCSGVFAAPFEKPESRMILYTDAGYVNYTNTVASFGTIQVTSWTFAYNNALYAVYPMGTLSPAPSFTYYFTISWDIINQCNFITNGLNMVPATSGIAVIDQAMTTIVNYCIQGQAYCGATRPSKAAEIQIHIIEMQELQRTIIYELKACSDGSFTSIHYSSCTDSIMYKISAFLMIAQRITTISITSWSHDMVTGDVETTSTSSTPTTPTTPTTSSSTTSSTSTSTTSSTSTSSSTTSSSTSTTSTTTPSTTTTSTSTPSTTTTSSTTSSSTSTTSTTTPTTTTTSSTTSTTTPTTTTTTTTETPSSTTS